MGNLAYNEIASSLFLVPISYEDDIPNTPVDDYTLHTTKQAAEKLLKLELEKQLGMSLEKYVVELESQGKGPESLKGQTVTMNNGEAVPFYGGERYSFATTSDGASIQFGKTMHITTIVNNGHTYIPLFTDFQELQAIYGEHVRVGLYTYKDILERLNDSAINNGTISQIEGIVINPASNAIIHFSKEDIEHNENLRNGSEQDGNNSAPTPMTQKQQIAEQFENIAKRENKKLKFCKASMIIGILAFFLDITPIMGIVAVVLGSIGLPKEKNAEGRGKAIAGIITGAINILFGIICIIAILFG